MPANAFDLFMGQHPPVGELVAHANDVLWDRSALDPVVKERMRIALAEEISGRTLALERHGAAAGDVRRTRADVEKAEAELGWHPTTSLADGLEAQWAWVAGRVATP